MHCTIQTAGGMFQCSSRHAAGGHLNSTNVARSTAARAADADATPAALLPAVAVPSILRARWHVELISLSSVRAMKAVCCVRRQGRQGSAVREVGRPRSKALLCKRISPLKQGMPVHPN